MPGVPKPEPGGDDEGDNDDDGMLGAGPPSRASVSPVADCIGKADSRSRIVTSVDRAVAYPSIPSISMMIRIGLLHVQERTAYRASNVTGCAVRFRTVIQYV